MPVRKRKGGATPADPPVLSPIPREPEIFQEIIIRSDGTVEIPWVTPKASDLVMGLWKQLGNKQSFPVEVIAGDIYCG